MEDRIRQKLVNFLYEVVNHIIINESEEIWAATCDFHQCGIFTSIGSDEPVQPPFKLKSSK